MSHHEPTVDGCTCGWQHGLTEGDEPCVHGHFDCAQTEGGPCTNQRIAERFAHHLNTERSVMTDAVTAPYIPLNPQDGAKGELSKLDGHEWPWPDDLGRKPFSEDLPGGAVRNAYRASFVTGALKAYDQRTAPGGGEELETVVGDLLADLMHLCDLFVYEDKDDAEGFQGILERARRRYAEEVAGE